MFLAHIAFETSSFEVGPRHDSDAANRSRNTFPFFYLPFHETLFLSATLNAR